jgi:hypothetical protein
LIKMSPNRGATGKTQAPQIQLFNENIHYPGSLHSHNRRCNRERNLQ